MEMIALSLISLTKTGLARHRGQNDIPNFAKHQPSHGIGPIAVYIVAQSWQSTSVSCVGV